MGLNVTFGRSMLFEKEVLNNKKKKINIIVKLIDSLFHSETPRNMLTRHNLLFIITLLPTITLLHKIVLFISLISIKY